MRSCAVSFRPFLGLPLEWLGVAYYAIISISYAVALILPDTIAPSFGVFLLTISAGAFLFSLYLIFIQAFYLKEWCTWCLGSAGLSTIIFLAAIAGSQIGLGYAFYQYQPLFGVLLMVGLALGVGGATITDVLFLKFLRDFRISPFEADVLRTLSQISWLGLGIVVISGVILYVPMLGAGSGMGLLTLKLVILAIISVNALFYYLYVSPKLMSVSFQHHASVAIRHELHRLRRVAFALGAISLTTWYTALILAMTFPVTVNAWWFFGTYILVLAATILLSQLIERRISHRSLKSA